jgi:hypothetical protein
MGYYCMYWSWGFVNIDIKGFRELVNICSYKILLRLGGFGLVLLWSWSLFLALVSFFGIGLFF